MNSYFNLEVRDAIIYCGTLAVVVVMVALLYQLTIGFGPQTHPAKLSGDGAATTRVTPIPQQPIMMREISSGYYYP